LLSEKKTLSGVKSKKIKLKCIFQIGGYEGAAKIAELLRSEGVDAFDFVLDEGLMATDKIIPGVSKPVAL
jgi:hypothetical protein